MRAVLDPNVLVAAVLSPSGTPAKLLQAWNEGAFELVVSPHLLEELERVVAYPKLRRRISAEDAGAFVASLREGARVAEDPAAEHALRSTDPEDDYLLALANEVRAPLVSGDAHLLALAPELPVLAPAAFLARLPH